LENKLAVVEELLKAGAKLSATGENDGKKLDCLHLALEEGHKEVAEVLKKEEERQSAEREAEEKKKVLPAGKTKVSSSKQRPRKSGGDEEQARVFKKLSQLQENPEWKQLNKFCELKEVAEQERRFVEALTTINRKKVQLKKKRAVLEVNQTALKKLVAQVRLEKKEVQKMEMELAESCMKLEELKVERNELLKQKGEAFKLQTIKKRGRLERKLAYLKEELNVWTDDQLEKEKLEKKVLKVEGKLKEVELIRPVADAEKATLYDLLEVNKHGWPKEPKNTSLFQFVGKGAQGKVYRGFFINKKKEHLEVAVKLFPAASSGLDNEIKTWSGLKHPNLVKFYDFRLWPSFAIISEWIEGCNLTVYLHRCTGAVEVKLSVKIAKEVASALKYLHENDIIHRDVKPDNILLEQKEEGTVIRAVLTDFGIAKKSASTVVTKGVEGSLLWMSPEAFEGSVSPKADIYALGICMWQMSSGKPHPFQTLLPPEACENPFVVRDFVKEDKNRPELCGAWPKELNLLITDCWLTDHKKRPTADQLLTQLNKL